jgi:hypothetical protein
MSLNIRQPLIHHTDPYCIVLEYNKDAIEWDSSTNSLKTTLSDVVLCVDPLQSTTFQKMLFSGTLPLIFEIQNKTRKKYTFDIQTIDSNNPVLRWVCNDDSSVFFSICVDEYIYWKNGTVGIQTPKGVHSLEKIKSIF